MTLGIIQFSCCLVGQITAGLACSVSFGFESCGTHGHILLFYDHLSPAAAAADD
jgi:hypothetical protein